MSLPNSLSLSEKRKKAADYLRGRQPVSPRLSFGIPRRNSSAPAPLSYAQQRLWFLDRLVPNSPFYNVPAATRLKMPLDPAVVRATLNEIVRRHEALRTSIREIDGSPVQVIAPQVEIPFTFRDLQHMPAAERERQAFRLATEDARAPFDLRGHPLLRAGILRLGPEDHVFLLNFHHIAADGWSMGVLVKEFQQIYHAFAQGRPSPLPELPIQYADFAAWQREMLTTGRFEQQMSFWTQQLSSLPTLELPCDFPRREVQGFEGETQYFIFPARLTRDLREFARAHSVTLFQLLFAGFNALLQRYTGQDEIVIGEPIANRNHVELEPLIGFFVNSLVLRTDLSNDPTFAELLRRSRAVALDADANQDIPFEVLVERLKPERTMGRNPLFQVSLQFFTGADAATETTTSSESIQVEKGTASLDLAFDLINSDRGLLARVEYSTELFRGTTIRRMVTHYENLLQAFVSNPQLRLSKAPMLVSDELQQVLALSSSASIAAPPPAEAPPLIHSLFEVQASRTPERVAVECGQARFTFDQLNRAANRLARVLKGHDFGPEQIALVFLDRSIESVIAMLAVWKAGGAHLPVDPRLPPDRLRFVLTDAKPALIVTRSKLSVHFKESACPVVVLEEVAAETPDDNLPEVAGLENLAYIIYTSGSSGQPKGVMVEQGALLRQISWMLEEFPLTSEDRCVAKYSVTFDVYLLEVLYPLLAGARLTIVPDEGPVDLSKLARLVHDRAITVLDVVPSSLPSLLDNALFTAGGALRRIICGGEVLTCELLGRLQERLNAEVINMYGPTEATISATFWRAPRDAELDYVPIGGPASGYSTYVLDPAMNLLSPGIPGELFLGGECLARGYLNQPELTRARFGPDPFCKNPLARLYRTGDRCCWTAEGNLKFLSRMDGQVKLRGYRIELAEIEAVLNSNALVKSCAAALVADRGEERLAAYIVPNLGEPELWPSVGEYFIYDELLYQMMTQDRVRLNAYRAAIEHSVRGKVVADLGTGADLVLARLCLEAGAERVYAVEMLPDAFARAQKLALELGSRNRLLVLHADIRELRLPEQVDLCVSELIGTIASSEGVIDLLNNARRLLRPGGEMIPFRAITKVAAVCLPPGIAAHPAFKEIPEYYTRRIFEQAGHPFDVRVCLKNLPAEAIVSDVAVFEDLPFQREIAREETSDFRLRILRDTRVDGLLLWINLFTSPHDLIDIRSAECTWLPVFLPVFSPGIGFRAGDSIHATASRLLETGAFTPDYLVRGTALRAGQADCSFTFESRRNETAFRANPFYQALHDSLQREKAALDRAAPAEHSRVNEWKEIYEQIYSPSGENRDTDFDIVGWNSSYTGKPLDREDMLEQVQSTVRRLKSLGARSILEIGCGTGLLLLELASAAERYVGTDFSPVVLEQVRRQIAARGWGHVELHEGPADEVHSRAPEQFDLIILNSIIQYFPSVGYLRRVLEQSVTLLKPDGFLFVGDVRSLPLLPLLHAELELDRGASGSTVRQFFDRVERRLQHEQELVIDPEFFHAFATRTPGIAGSIIQLKRGCHLNELTRFRYDALLPAGEKEAIPDEFLELSWEGHQAPDTLRQLLSRQPERPVLLRGVPNGRVALAGKWLEKLRKSNPGLPLEALPLENGNLGFDPEQLWSLQDDLPWQIYVLARSSTPYCYDVLCVPIDRSFRSTFFPGNLSRVELKPWTAYANAPEQKPTQQLLTQKVRALLRERLPDYMVPSIFVWLDSLPLTPSGKLDRRALPDPDFSANGPATLTPPETDLHRHLLQLWKEILETEKLGIDSHFFNSGGHSLMAMQVTSRLSTSLGFEVPLRLMFERPTIRDLSETLSRMQESAVRETIPPLVPIADLSIDPDQLSEEQVDALLRKLIEKTPQP
jgi:amino acid adenylation domain-containing protein